MAKALWPVLCLVSLALAGCSGGLPEGIKFWGKDDDRVERGRDDDPRDDPFSYVNGAVPLGAFMPKSNARPLMTSVSREQITQMLETDGFQVATLRQDDGELLVVTTPSGTRFAINLKVCAGEAVDSTCRGIEMVASYDTDPFVNQIRPVIERFNQEYVVAKAFIADGDTVLQRYLITDGGVTLDHIRHNLNEFLGSADRLARVINSRTDATLPYMR